MSTVPASGDRSILNKAVASIDALRLEDPAADAKSLEGKAPHDYVHEHDADSEVKSPLWYRIATVAVVIIPFLSLFAAGALAWGWAFSWVYLVMVFFGWLITGLGITVGYHRFFTHKSFDAGPVMTVILGIMGSMAVQGPLLVWAHNHRKHHQHSDRDGDVHSPHAGHGEGIREWFRGAWFSHIGWLFKPQKIEFDRYVPDLKSQPIVRFISKTFILWVLLGLIIPALIAFAIFGTWQSAVLGFIWGGLVRVFIIHHVTWSVNSICHLFGSKTYRSHDESRNNPIFGILALGEGWHNNHHAFPASARHGLAWWQFDISYVTIKLLSYVGLTRNVRVPDAARKAAKRIGPAK